MARARHLGGRTAEDVYSGVDITIDLTDSALRESTSADDGGSPRVIVALPDAGQTPSVVSGPQPVVLGTGQPRDLSAAQPSGESAIPGWLLRRSRSDVFSAGIFSFVYRVTDVALASLSVLLLLPLMLAAAVAVKLDSPGPIFYRHSRLGRDGKAFGVLKFRSMVADADRLIEEASRAVADRNGKVVDAPTFKSEHDPRVTRVGRFLRRSGIDEIPQMFNVIAGQMSVVGPRPLVAEEVELLSQEDAEVRHSVRPGITCLWQIFRTENTSFAERMHMDVLYVQHRSWLVYVALVVITPLALFRGRGAY